MPEELTFSSLVDFLADHEGKKVYVEIGTRDREAREQPTDAFLLTLYGHRLGAIQDATDPDVGGERRAIMVRLHSIDAPPVEDEKDLAGTRLFFNPRQVTEIQGEPQRGLKVWLDDKAVYIGLNG